MRRRGVKSVAFLFLSEKDGLFEDGAGAAGAHAIVGGQSVLHMDPAGVEYRMLAL